MKKKAQAAQVEMLAAAALFALLVIGAVYAAGRTASTIEAYAQGVQGAISSGAQMQKAAYLASEPNASMPTLGNISTARLQISKSGSGMRPYNGSRLIVLNGSVYIMKWT
ncbi:MAG: hypothetical protein M1158_04385 [Candidatus Marsarchaeota archaeon]|jgi:hypothetical protein|nr:hypothetical protein [Candidatus Marsarchaeota archaeon]